MEKLIRSIGYYGRLINLTVESLYWWEKHQPGDSRFEEDPVRKETPERVAQPSRIGAPTPVVLAGVHRCNIWESDLEGKVIIEYLGQGGRHAGAEVTAGTVHQAIQKLMESQVPSVAGQMMREFLGLRRSKVMAVRQPRALQLSYQRKLPSPAIA